MCYYDSFDICEAYYLVEYDYNRNGWLPERPSNQRRRESIGVQLHRMWFRPAVGLSYETMSDNGREIYDMLVERYKLPKG